MTDEQAVHLARDGHKEAFRELFDRHKAGVYGVASRYSQSPQDAEDILQETFIRAFRAIYRFGDSGNPSFAAWIHRICLHRCIDHLRQGKRRGADLTDAFGGRIDGLATADPPPERSADQAMLMSRVREAYAVLSPKQRIAFDLKYFRFQEIPEIAAALGCSESAVKTHLGRAVVKLRNRIAPIVEEL